LTAKNKCKDAATIAVRVTLETIAVIFKTCEYLKNINDRG